MFEVLFNMKKARITIVIVFIAFLVVVSGGSLLMKDRKFSPNENRYLADPPQLSVDNILSGKFQEGLEDYLRDHNGFPTKRQASKQEAISRQKGK